MIICDKCKKEVTEFKLRQDRKPGLNPYESALSIKNGFTEPKPCCNLCNEYLDLDKISEVK